MTDTTTNIKSQLNLGYLPINDYLGRLSKRAFDLFASFLGMVLLSPLYMLIAILIKRDSPGPVFYRGRRMGRGEKFFSILKFRTMYERPESYRGACITAKDDGRITPLGKWLRDTKVNELPQLWNVLKGEMSLVGPRPEDPDIAMNWPSVVRREILSLRPGITSPASVIYRSEEKMLKTASVLDDYLKDILPDKLRLDQLYVRHHTFLSDLDLIFYTLIVLLPGLRNNSIPAESLYNGFLARFTQRYFSWFLIDNIVAFAAVGLAGVFWRMNGPLDLGMGMSMLVASALALAFSLVNSVFGLGRVWWRYARLTHVFELALSSGITTLLLMALDFSQPASLLPRGMLPIVGLLAFLGFVSVRYRERLLTGLAARWLALRPTQGGIGERVLIVGAGECGLLASWLLRRSNLSTAFSIVGLADDNPAKEGMTIEGHRVLGLTRSIPSIVAEKHISVILFALEQIHPAEQARILGLCHQTPARVVVIPDLLNLLREWLMPLTKGALQEGVSATKTSEEI